MHFKRIILTVTIITALLTSTATARTLGIGSSNPGTISNSTGSAIAKLITEQMGIQTRVQPHSGNSAFIPAVNAGEVDFGCANNFEMKDAIAGTGVFKGQVLKDLRVVTVLMPLRSTFWVEKDSPIKTVKDLKGKRVPGEWTSQKIVTFLSGSVLANAGLTYDDVQMVPVANVNGSVDDFIQKKSDTFYIAVGSAKIREAGAKVGGVRALPLDTSPEAVARLQKVLPTGYPLLVKPSKADYGIIGPTHVLAMDFLFITNKNLPDDLIYDLAKALHGGKKALFASFKPLGANFSPDKMAKVLFAGEYHPGAIKFYKEIGQWPPKN